MSEVLHALRIKGRVTAEDLSRELGLSLTEVEAELTALAAMDRAFERTTGRRPGWTATATGREAHEQQIMDERTEEVMLSLAEAYEGFLHVNGQVKRLCSQWQAQTDEMSRFDVMTQLRDAHAQAAPSIEAAGETLPRFSRYRVRLEAALDQVPDDPRYVVSPLVDSYHTVWFECHEDFLVTLGRSRTAEGSY